MQQNCGDMSLKFHFLTNRFCLLLSLVVTIDTNSQDNYASYFALTIVSSCKSPNEYYHSNGQNLNEILCLPFLQGSMNRRGFLNTPAQQEVQKVKVTT